MAVLCALCGFVVQKWKRFTDGRLWSVVVWWLLLMDILFDLVFNAHLWSRGNYGSAVIALMFLIGRLCYDIGWQLSVALKEWKRDITIRERVQEYAEPEWMLFLFALCSGSS